MKLKKQVTVCGAAIFCVAVFSLYLMLDRVQHDPARHQNGGNFPRVSHTSFSRCISPAGEPCGTRTPSSPMVLGISPRAWGTDAGYMSYS